MAKKDKDDSVKLSYSVQNDTVTFRWSDQKSFKTVSLEKFQNAGLMKKAPWMYDVHCSATDTLKHHARFKEVLNNFYKETH